NPPREYRRALAGETWHCAPASLAVLVGYGRWLGKEHLIPQSPNVQRLSMINPNKNGLSAHRSVGDFCSTTPTTDNPIFPSSSKIFPSTTFIMTIWWGMPFHTIIRWRTITPTQATGLNKKDEKEQKQSSPGSLH